MDLNKLFARAKAILVTPKTEWPVIAAEPATTGGLYAGYILILAAIPAVMGFVKWTLIGVNVPFLGTVRLGLTEGLTSLITRFVASLVGVYVVGLIVNVLAPTFSGQKNGVQALKSVAYAMTASSVASVAVIVPGIGVLIWFAGAIYGIYLLYLGLPHTMKCPADKSAGYTALVVIVSIVLGIIVSIVLTRTGLMGPMGRSPWQHPSQSSSATFDKNSPVGQLVELGKRAQEASQQGTSMQKPVDAGQTSGSSAHVEAIAPDTIKQYVPDSLSGMKRTDLSVDRTGLIGIQVTEARATYQGDDGRMLRLEITDLGTAKGIAALATWAGGESEHVTDHAYDKTYKQGDQLVHEKWDSSSQNGEYGLLIGQRFAVSVSGRADNVDQLKAAVTSLNLTGLEALKDEGTKAN